MKNHVDIHQKKSKLYPRTEIPDISKHQCTAIFNMESVPNIVNKCLKGKISLIQKDNLSSMHEAKERNGLCKSQKTQHL